jgi:collagen type IV alpha-3-binding protein
VIKEEEFFDAVDATLDKLESEVETKMERNREDMSDIIRHTPTANTPGSVVSLPSENALYAEVSQKRLPKIFGGYSRQFPYLIRARSDCAATKWLIGNFLFFKINSVIDEHIKYSGNSIDSSVWEAIHDEGEMRVYRREMEEDGMIVDPLKAVHSVQVRFRIEISIS